MFEKINAGSGFWNKSLLPWLVSSGVRILFIVLGAFLLYFIAKKIIHKTVKVLVVKNDEADHDNAGEMQREHTLIQIFILSSKILISIISSLMIAAEFGLKIGPILASAGVIGLALGFGGQYLIKDLISGLFIIIENQYRIHDFIEAAGKSGQVERISLRMTSLRDLDGNLHFIPHGEIKTVTNLSKNFSGVNLNIGIGYGTDLDKAIKIINETGKTMATDKYWGKFILTAPQFLRVNELGDSAVILKVTGNTKPSEHWAVAGEMRKRLYDAFNSHDIEIPFPQRVVHIIDDKKR